MSKTPGGREEHTSLRVGDSLVACRYGSFTAFARKGGEDHYVHVPTGSKIKIFLPQDGDDQTYRWVAPGSVLTVMEEHGHFKLLNEDGSYVASIPSLPPGTMATIVSIGVVAIG